MNFSSFFSYNNCMNQKFYYLLILNGIIILILGIYVFYRRENKIIKEEIDYSDNINQSVKLNDLYNEKVKKINIDFEMKDEEEINEDNILGRIIIEKINLDYFIFNEYTNKNLKVLPCRLSGDSVNENISIIGHNYENGTFFSNIHKLDINDEVKLIIKKKEYRYLVYKKYEVFENDLEPLKLNGYSEITLITCNNLNKKRYIIKCKNIESRE